MNFEALFAGLPLEAVAALMAAAFLAAFLDAIAGGGGLLTVPALVLAGLDPVAAVATNKVQGTASVASSTHAFARAGHLDLRGGGGSIFGAVIAAALASVAGAACVSLLPQAAVRGGLPVLLVAVALYFALSPRMSDEDARARLSPGVFALTAVPLVGFYDGAFGPGAGSLYLAVLVTLAGLGVVRATARTKLLNLASNLGSLVLFAAAGRIAWGVGLAMAPLAMLGARLGAGLAMRHGARLVRPLIVMTTLAVALRLLADPAHPLRAWLAG